MRSVIAGSPTSMWPTRISPNTPTRRSASTPGDSSVLEHEASPVAAGVPPGPARHDVRLGEIRPASVGGSPVPEREGEIELVISWLQPCAFEKLERNERLVRHFD